MKMKGENNNNNNSITATKPGEELHMLIKMMGHELRNCLIVFFLKVIVLKKLTAVMQ